VPARFFDARRAIERLGDRINRERTDLRYTHQWGGVTARYNLDRARRLEFRIGARRTGFEWQTVTRISDPIEQKTVKWEFQETPAGKPLYIAEAQAAFVTDTSVSGPTSPILGHRYRVEVEPAVSHRAFADVRVDLRRYFMPVRPVTFAARVEHVGRYGPGATDPRLTPLVLGLQTLVRGYDLRSFAADECGQKATTCSLLNELNGSRLALMNLEVRAPLLGLVTGDIDYGRLPLEVLAFVDAGLLWTERPGFSIEQDRFRSIGAGARANVGGIVFEMTAARPFDRSRGGWTASLLLRPGF
jgi:outer membrane protein assembly factor BamA